MADERNPNDKSEASEEFGDRPEHEVADEVGMGLGDDERDEDEDQNEDDDEQGEENEPIIP